MLIAETMDKAFGEEIKPENFLETAQKIRNALYEVNNMHLPLAEYEVNGEKYQVRVPYDIAVDMETEAEGEKKLYELI